MGGWPPLGYEVENRRLVVVEREAAIVRRIFDRFAKTGSALTVARELNAAGEVTKRRECADGIRGGKPWTKGAIYKVLANRVYLGEAVHKGVAYPGEHAAIIDQRDLGQGPRGDGRAGAPTRRRDPGPGACAPEGPDLRPERPADVAEPHPPTRPDLSLLRDPRGDRGRLRHLRGDERAGRRRRGRRARSRPEAARCAGAGRPDLGDGEAGGRGRDHRARGHGLLADFATVWNELFPAEQARIVQLLVERVDVQEDALEVRIRAEGLASLVGELRQQGERKAA